MPVVDLTVDRNLLCPNFDGYKLSFDAVPVLRQGLEGDPLKLEPHHNQYSLLHMELFGRHNLLVSDPWARYNSYYVNKDHQVVLCSYDAQHGQPRDQRIIYNMQRSDHGDGYGHLVGDYNYTLRFISEQYCVLCDGITTLHLLQTGNREHATPWVLLARTQIMGEEMRRGFLLYDARLDIVQERKQISLAMGHVSAHPPEEQVAGHFMKVIWSHWTAQSPNNWTYNICQQLETKGSIYYCAFEPRAESLVICSNAEIQTQAEREAAALAIAATINHSPSAFTWSQSIDHLLLRFPLPIGAVRNDFDVNNTRQDLLVKFKEELILDGSLFASVDHALTTWTVEREQEGVFESPQQLHLTLIKNQSQLWPHLLDSPDLAPPETPLPEPPLEQERLPIPNLEEPIEDCDLPIGCANDDIKMVRFNLATLEITHTVFLGHSPPLFSTSLRPGYPAAFATRQGVDAAVWLQHYQPAKPQEWSVRHEGSLHAFGYVQASKQQRKFIDCCPDLDYAVITESYRHVFIYKHRYDSAGGLRNRNGPQVVIGKQSLVTLDEDVGEVLGLVTAPNVIALLTEHAILYLQI